MLNSNALSNSVNHYGKGKWTDIGQWLAVYMRKNSTFTVDSG